MRASAQPLLFALWAYAADRALVSVAARARKKNTFMCVAVCESSSGRLTQTGKRPGCWLGRREKGELEKAERSRGRTPRHRGHTGEATTNSGSLHRTITSKAQDSSGEPPLAEEEEVDGRGGGSYSKTAVWITVSHRHSSFHPE